MCVSGGSHARPPESPAGGSPGHRRSRWRIGTPIVVLLCGGLFVVSAMSSDGTDLRPGRYTDLASLVKDESDQYDALRQRAADLDDEVAELSAAIQDSDVDRYQRRIAELRDPAGLVPRTGPGVTVTMSDAPEDVINATTGNVNNLLVHQQDLQALVNALWSGGATAVTIAGQRVVSSTGIKCEGNAVLLQGVPYPQPYEVSAVGDQGELLRALEDDAYLQGYRADAADPQGGVGWDLALEDSITAPAFDGLLGLGLAEPIDQAGS